VIKRSDHEYSTPFDLEFIEVRPWQASELVCVVLARTSEGLVSPRVLKGARVGVAASSDLAGSIIVEIFVVLKAGT